MAYGFLFVLCTAASLAWSKPIMVSFGTNKGPIIPPTPSSTTVNPLAPRNAAPVFEQVDDIPNPNPYKAPTPNQYRKQILSYKPNPNLILGTPLDIKYALNDAKYDLYNKKAQVSANGVGYAGPQFFVKQAYEIERERKKSKLYENRGRQSYAFQKIPERTEPHVNQYQPTQQTAIQSTQAAQKLSTNTQQYQPTYRNQRTADNNNNQQQVQPDLQTYQAQRKVDQYQQGSYSVREDGQPQNYFYQYNHADKRVPAIGILYSSGLRYYVPQIAYYNNNNNNNVQSDSENSVYENNENKYVYDNQHSQQYRNNY